MLYNAVMDGDSDVYGIQQLPLLVDERFAPYAGKWVAVVRGRVAGVGETARQARMMARRSCPKDDPILLLVPSYGEAVGS